MVKSKAKKAASKTVQSKTFRKRVGRPTNASITEAKGSPRTNGAHHHNGHNNGNGNGTPGSLAAATEPTTETRLDAGSIRTKSGVDLTEKVKELLLLAKEQGHLTYDDINDALPESVVTPEDLDQIYTKLANLEVEIVDQAEVDRVKQPEAEEEEEKGRLDILDDPVRMYLRQMGKVRRCSRGNRKWPSASGSRKPKMSRSGLFTASVSPPRNTLPWPKN